MGFAHELARCVNDRPYDELPEDVLQAALIPIVDTIGVAIAGSRQPLTVNLETALGTPSLGPCALLGRDVRTSTERAVMANALAIHALDFDDSSQISGAHPSTTLLPVALALTEEEDGTGRQMIDGYVTGFETMTRLGRAVMPAHYERGWHPTSTLGVFGAAAVAARLLRLDDTRFANALAIAASLASGIKSNFGTDTKALQVAIAAWKGALAARLSAAGMSASRDAFEHHHGFFEVYHGAGACDPDSALSSRSLSNELRSPGIAIKQHPCCGSTHSVIDAILKLHARIGTIPFQRIVSITTRTHPSRLKHTNRPNPRTDTDAKFSLQYVTACALISGAVRLADFKNGAFLEPTVRMLMARITTETHQDPDAFLGTITIEFDDGAVIEECATTKFGRDANSPLSADELRLKFQDCLAEGGSSANGSNLYGVLMNMERRNMRDITAMLTSALGRHPGLPELRSR